ncbi:MAG: IMPACT family protein [Promethearchaeota archaeon]
MKSSRDKKDRIRILHEIRASGRSNRLKIKKSIFICSIGKVDSVERAKTFISRVREDFPKATHHAFAYRVGCPVEWEDCSDDGEPRGTAGPPIMNILQKQNITNTCVVVSRFYGGIKLGTGGLVKAYQKSAVDLIKLIGIVPITN